MFCYNCGKQLPNTSVFCAYCGAPQIDIADVDQDIMTDEQDVYSKQPQFQPNKVVKRRPVVLWATLLLLAVLGCTAFYFLAVDGGANNLLSFAGNTQKPNTSEEGVKSYPTKAENIVADEMIGTLFVNNELLLYVNEDVIQAEVEAFVYANGGTIVGHDNWLYKYQIQLDSEYMLSSLEDIRIHYENSGLFRRVRINLAIPIEMNYTPNDKEWRSEWGSSPGGKNWGAKAIRAPEMWGIQGVKTSAPVNVGVFDNQFYTDHEDLQFADTLYNRYDNNDWGHEDPQKRTYPSHGTHVAGIIAATFNNGKGIAGIAPRVNLFGVSALGLTRSVNSGIITVTDLEAGLTNLICAKKCKVVNFSYTSSVNEAYIEDVVEALLYYINRYHAEFLIVAAAGNGDSKGLPVNSLETSAFTYISNSTIKDRIIVVGAAKLLNSGEIKVADYSNNGSRVDLLAPGGSDKKDGPRIYSTVYQDWNLINWQWSNNGYDYMQGTSMAAPHVSGVAAVMWSLNPHLTGAEVKQLLSKTASGSYGYEDSAKYKDQYKLLDAYEAVKAAAELIPIGVPNVGFEPENMQTLLLNVGDMYEFGDFEWIVLNVQDEKALLLTKDIVLVCPYNDDSIADGKTVTSNWETSKLRSYLNGAFLEKFSNAECSQILDTPLESDLDSRWFNHLVGAYPAGANSANIPDNRNTSVTKDKVFILSLEECQNYLVGRYNYSSDGKRFINDEYNSRRQATYSAANSTIRKQLERYGTVPEGINNVYWLWWLRTPGVTSVDAPSGRNMYVVDDGKIDLQGGDAASDVVGIRPALWLNLRGAKPNIKTPPSETNRPASQQANAGKIDQFLDLREKCARLGAEYDRITEAAKADGSIFAVVTDGDYVQLLTSLNSVTTELSRRFGSLPNNRGALETWTENDLNVAIELMTDLASLTEKAIAMH